MIIVRTEKRTEDFLSQSEDKRVWLHINTAAKPVYGLAQTCSQIQIYTDDETNGVLAFAEHVLL